jgi:hypothetical protein
MAIKKCSSCGKPIKFHNQRCKKCYDFWRCHRPVLYQNKEWLKEQYGKGLSFDSIAKLAKCGHSSIAFWFKKFDLKSRPAPCRGVCQRELNSQWKGGITHASGYRYVHHPEYHSYKTRNYYVPESVLVMESILGRKLIKPETVHHKNGIRNDNRPENLQLFPNQSSHKKYEAQLLSFVCRLLFGELSPELKSKLLELLNTFLSKNE